MMSRLAIAATLIVAGWCASVGPAHAEPPPPPPPAPKTIFEGNGTYAVGADIAPGTYESAGPVDDGACYWKRVKDADIVDNAYDQKAAGRADRPDRHVVHDERLPAVAEDPTLAPPPAARAGRTSWARC